MLKFKLWRELSSDPMNRRDVFSGKLISASDLFSDRIQIEDILPFSKTLDNSQSNLTITFADVNSFKRDRDPYSAFGEDVTSPIDYEDIRSRAYSIWKHKPAKLKRFDPKAIANFNDDNPWLARQ